MGGIWRDLYIWHEQRPVHTPQQQQEVNGFKDGSMVTRYTLDLCSSTISVQIEGWKKNEKKNIIQGRVVYLRLPGSPAPRGFGDLIRYRDPVPAPVKKGGSGASKKYQIGLQSKWLEDVFICFYYLPICSHFKSTLILMKLCYSSLHGVSCCFRKTFFRSTGQSEHNGPFASPGLAN